MAALGLDEVWWLVSPGNPLKVGNKDMAPLAARFASAERQARGARIVPTAIEARLGTRYTVDTLTRLTRLYPRRRFIWIMGADNLAQFDRWKDWRRIARTMPIRTNRARSSLIPACRVSFQRSNSSWARWFAASASCCFL